MIDKEHFDEVMAEVRRLASLKGWRRDTAFQSELVRIVLKFGTSVLLLRMAVDRMTENWDHCPTPAELRNELDKTAARPADDPVPKWRAEFRAEVRKALLAQEQLSDCRERRDWLDYLQYAYTQHPTIVNEERDRMGLTQLDPPAQMTFGGEEKRSKPGDPMVHTGGFFAGVLASLNGKNTDADYARLRRNGIRDALRAVADSDNNPDPNSRQFWADHLAWAEREHADEVAQLRAEPI